MKRFIRYTLLLLVLCFAFGQVKVLKPDREGFSAAELFPVPKKTYLYRWGRDCAAQAGLPEPSEVLCGPVGAFAARFLPWVFGLWLLLRLTGRRGWLIAAILLLALLPDWFFPTRLSDIRFWTELGESLCGSVQDWLSLSPALRDEAWKCSWWQFLAAMVCCAVLLPRRTNP